MDILNTLGINFKSVIVQGVGFLILLFVLKKFLFGKISALMKERSEGIKSSYAKIEGDKSAVEKMKIDYQVKLAEVETAAAMKIQEAIDEGGKLGEGIVSRAQDEAELIRLKAQEGIEQERKKALTEIRNQVVSLSMLASSRIIQQSINQQTAETLVDDVIKDMEGLSVR
ncbi:ATP synthase subunit b [Candidatus Kuenenia stuttgartiensis]|uniref:ATP synthase subunit b n=1 Tax=Kuenenia stuttgartiensis TaxID=174633 RepID=A0A2C9CAF7_KUEST|nr:MULTISPECIES: F0F1 ATP synthase subunit B [Kuenenia]MBE7546946.1 F0F1 ATP synthase subunit B [Planctomycetia bacterium]MBW7942696.1 F0F1 ATP synthase subunit B [Candidatus Kuenenia stuttgartiensis]MBZ0191931.1 F0F1 ATP synthase subunit B [Candidatus Kuenenia stuttgartiensis]MCL4726240.1 F0F1 ATP synthase subunit B [Candidatus Kuenenia stuttgartiensis]MCZ7623124.1 F0F1 ATP synthase subunit B [Candidatus Kuenenia sp.]